MILCNVGNCIHSINKGNGLDLQTHFTFLDLFVYAFETVKALLNQTMIVFLLKVTFGAHKVILCVL